MPTISEGLLEEMMMLCNPRSECTNTTGVSSTKAGITSFPGGTSYSCQCSSGRVSKQIEGRHQIPSEGFVFHLTTCYCRHCGHRSARSFTTMNVQRGKQWLLLVKRARRRVSLRLLFKFDDVNEEACMQKCMIASIWRFIFGHNEKIVEEFSGKWAKGMKCSS